MAHSPYNETEMVGLFTDIYKIFIRLGHMPEEEVIWAPEGGHTLDTSLLDPNITIDDKVMSLMRALPLPAAEYPYEQFCDHMCAIDYRRPLALARSRDVDKMGPNPAQGERNQPQQSNCRPTDMLLLDRRDAQGPLLAFNVEENVVRMPDGPDDNAYYRNLDAARQSGYTGPDFLLWPGIHAPSFFKQRLNGLISATLIPDFCGGLASRNTGADTDFDELRRVLTEDYRWPHADFRRDDWLQNGPQLMDTLLERRARNRWPDAHGNWNT